MCRGAVGAFTGAVAGAAVEAFSQYRAGEGYDRRKLVGAGARGGTIGMAAGATAGMSALGQESALAFGSAVGGAMDRQVDGDPSTDAGAPVLMGVDAGAGFVGGYAAGGVGGLAAGQAEVTAVSAQVARAEAARRGIAAAASGDSAGIAAAASAAQAATLEEAIVGLAAGQAPGLARSSASAATAFSLSRLYDYLFGTAADAPDQESDSAEETGQ